MVKALEIVDGVGLARPVCQEFYLPKDMLSGEVSGAIKQLLDENDFGITNLAAGTMIRQVRKDEEPIGMLKKENVDAFFKDLETWGKKMAADKEHKEYGYIDLGPKGAAFWGCFCVSWEWTALDRFENMDHIVSSRLVSSCR
jgi:hypothetical protein